MTTILFVHGTGVRARGYEETMEQLRRRLAFTDHPNLRVEGCLWGERFGSRRAEKSIFRYTEAGGGEYSPEDAKRDTWALLAADPMAGLRFLALNREPYRGGAPGAVPPGRQLENAVDGLGETKNWNDLRPFLEWMEIASTFPDACTRLKADDAFLNLKRVATPPLDPYRDAIAEALVALSINILAEGDPEVLPYISLEENARDRATAVIRAKLGGVSAGVTLDMAKKIGGAILRPLAYAGRVAAYAGNATIVTPLLNRRRGSVIESAAPIAGDILFYQCRGAGIRDYIKARIADVDPPVVILAHSLGGVACVDLLLDEAFAPLSDRVKLLITIGSQAPYFYEIGALQSLAHSDAENHVAHAFRRFPRWLNLHNRRDFLSYIGAGVFPGHVVDREVKSRTPFPESHSVYFSHDQTYAYVRKGLRWALGRPLS